MKLSVVIVNYNVKHFLEQALHSVFKASEKLDLDVWVVDNNSVDNSLEMVKTLFPAVKIIANSENLGFSKANNQAIRQSASEYVLLLNPDTLLQNDTLKKCVDFMDSHVYCGGLGVRMIDGKGKFLPESKRGLPTPAVALFKMMGLSALFPKSRIFGKYHLKYLNEFETHEIDVLSGAFMMLRRTVLDKVGLLDEDFFMYGEDIDLSYRITQSGNKNFYFPETTIIHYKGESTKKKSANYIKVFYQAMVLFANKHYSNKSAGWFAFFIAIAIKLRAFGALVLRFINAVYIPVLDFAIIYLGYFGIAKYWEEYNKYVHNFYPNQYYVLHIPVYIIFVLFSIFISGGYDRPLLVRRLVRGAFLGSLVVFAVYAFLPKDLQFSRAILGLGCVWAVISPILIRIFIQVLGKGNFSITGSQEQRIAVVANGAEAQRIRNLLSASMVHYDFLATVSAGEEKLDGDLGSFGQLDEVIEVFNINLVIFSSADVSSSEMMVSMSKHASDAVQFKIVPENAWVIIGSDSKNTPGELYSIDVKFSISEKFSRRRKRILDLALIPAFLLLLPLLTLKKNGRKLLANIPSVFLGLKTWISYRNASESENLPELKVGVFCPSDAYSNVALGANINLAYARDYVPQKDLAVLYKMVFH